MYGGGFATIPAYLKDLFGSYHVSAIHGRLLTAWSTAGIVGPLIVNGILDHYVANHLPKQQAYPVILHIMAVLMVVGFIANLPGASGGTEILAGEREQPGSERHVQQSRKPKEYPSMVASENKTSSAPYPGCMVRGFDTRRMGRLLHPDERTQALPIGPIAACHPDATAEEDDPASSSRYADSAIARRTAVINQSRVFLLEL